MNKECLQKWALPVLLLAGMFIAGYAFRPLLPIDETRYLTVAWEMFLRQDPVLLTLNFDPYFHKPPVMFWLINLSWTVFGVSRAAAMVPFFFLALAFVMLLRKLAEKLFPAEEGARERLIWITLGSVPFIIYSTLVMFDVMLSVFVMGFFLAALSYLEAPKFRQILLAGLCLGFGGLVKGPVVLVYTAVPLLIYGVWQWRKGEAQAKFGTAQIIFFGILTGLIVAGVWLFALLGKIGPDFLSEFIFKQTAGRIDGQMESSHARPLYFYLPLIPVLLLPWAFFPAFWRNAKAVFLRAKDSAGMRLVSIWFIGGVVIFSLISGKQPHYMVPLLPAVLLFIALCLKDVRIKTIQIVAIVLMAATATGEFVASKLVFQDYELERFAQIVHDNPDADWAFVRKYQGELGFLGRIDRKIDSLEHDEVEAWFDQHPDGFAIIRYTRGAEFQHYHVVYDQDYRSRALGIFMRDDKVDPPVNLPQAVAGQGGQ